MSIAHTHYHEKGFLTFVSSLGRAVIVKALGADDFFMIAATISYLVSSIVMCISTTPRFATGYHLCFLNVASDFLIYLWPAKDLAKIQISVKQRVTLIAMFSLGIVISTTYYKSKKASKVDGQSFPFQTLSGGIVKSEGFSVTYETSAGVTDLQEMRGEIIRTGVRSSKRTDPDNISSGSEEWIMMADDHEGGDGISAKSPV
ncbi:hypothetical protein N0V90_012514 [Kalmusia sp. IMI 367209]|nr:hypothetical protein N0V90_012514 [Kalmusia sp. IMI 367209]